MKKQLLLFGASLSTAMGMTLIMLVLVLTSTQMLYASSEAEDCQKPNLTCTKAGGKCNEEGCMTVDSDCGCGSTQDCNCYRSGTGSRRR